MNSWEKTNNMYKSAFAFTKIVTSFAVLIIKGFKDVKSRWEKRPFSGFEDSRTQVNYQL